MSTPILVTGAAGGRQGSTGNRVVQLLLGRDLPVRALVHQFDERSKRLRELGAEVVQGDLLDPDLVRNAMQDIERAYFTYPVDDGLLEATAIFAATAREAEGWVRPNSRAALEKLPVSTVRTNRASCWSRSVIRITHLSYTNRPAGGQFSNDLTPSCSSRVR